MVEPRWIREEFVLVAHRIQLARNGGITGVRDPGHLSSALSRPKNAWALLTPQPDVASLAAEYAYGIARNHPFLDGNKRTALVVCRTFLRLNGCDWNASQPAQIEVFPKLAAGELKVDDLAHWIREHRPS